MRIVQAGVVYFRRVFGAGFILVPFCITWLVPRLGERTTELVEMPVIL